MESSNSGKGEHYNLRWNNFSNNLIQVFSEHQLSEKLVDVTLICEGQYIKAHKLILSASSGFFMEMFRMHSTVFHPFILMNGIKFAHLKHIVEFIYQGEIKVLDTDLEGVLALGESFQIKGLSSVKLKHKLMPVDTKHTPFGLPADHSWKDPPSANNKTILPTVCSSFSAPVYQGSLNSPEILPAVKSPVMICHEVEPPPLKKIKYMGSLAAIRANLKANIDKSPERLKENEAFDKVTDTDDNKKNIFNGNSGTVNENKLSKTVVKVKNPKAFKNTNNTTEIKPKKIQYNVKLVNKIKESVDEKLNMHEPKLYPVSSSDYSTVKEKEEKVPPPPNAFMLFANEWRNKLAVEHPDENNKGISVRLGNLWKSLSGETKETYYAAARVAQLEHEKKCPGYVYNPSTARKGNKDNKRRKSVGSVTRFSQEFDSDSDDLQIIEVDEEKIHELDRPKSN